MGSESPGLCPALQKPCDGEACVFFQFFEGDECPVLLDRESLDVLEFTLKGAAAYLDQVMDIKPADPGSIASKIKSSIKEGRVDWNRIAKDLTDLIS